MKPKMIYTLWKKTEKNVRGCYEDESESTSYKSTFYLVSEEEAEDFGETMASDYGYQDYNYQVSYKEVCKLREENLQEIRLLIEDVEKKLEKKEE